MATPNSAVASLLKNKEAPQNNGEKTFNRKHVLYAIAGIGIIIAVIWFAGFMIGTKREAARKSGHASGEILVNGQKVNWDSDSGDDLDISFSNFAKSYDEVASDKEKEFAKTYMTNAPKNKRAEYARFVISSKYGTDNPSDVSVMKFIDMNIEGPSKYVIEEDPELDKNKEELALETEIANTFTDDWDVTESDMRLQDIKTGKCVGLSRTGRFERSLVDCKSDDADPFEIIGEGADSTLVSGNKLCFPFNSSIKKNRLLGRENPAMRKMGLDGHPCLTSSSKVKLGEGNYIIGIGEKCLSADTEGKNLDLSSGACTAEQRKFQIVNKEDLVEPLGANAGPAE